MARTGSKIGKALKSNYRMYRNEFKYSRGGSAYAAVHDTVITALENRRRGSSGS